MYLKNIEETLENINNCFMLIESIRTAERQLQVSLSKIQDEKDKERQRKKEDSIKKHEKRVKEIEKSNKRLKAFFSNKPKNG